MNALNIVFFKIWLLSDFEKIPHLNLERNQLPLSILESCGSCFSKFILVKFSKLTGSNPIFRYDFVCFHYRLCTISIQIIEHTRIILGIKDEEDTQMLQNDLHKLYQWADRNNMKFNANKFELLRYRKEQEIKSTTTYKI